MSVIDSVHYNIKGILWLRSNDVHHLAEEFNSDYGQVKTYRSLHSTDCKDEVYSESCVIYSDVLVEPQSRRLRTNTALDIFI